MIRTWLAAMILLMASSPTMAVVTGGGITGGTVFSRGGNFIVIANPAGLRVGNNNFDDNNVRAFNEVQNYRLTSTLLTDLGGAIGAGAVVDSHYFVFDSLRNQTAEGTATFATPVLAIIYSFSALQRSDALGAPGVVYLQPGARGLEPSVDFVSFIANTVHFRLSGSSPGDTFRVITETSVPEPSSWTMLMLGFAMLGAAVRRGRRASSAIDVTDSEKLLPDRHALRL